MKEVCNVTNKSAGRVVYNIKEDGVRRVFYPHETKKIKVSELEKLIQQPGGLQLLYHFLMINDRQVVRYLINGDVGPEYWLTEEKIPSWMESCSLAEFQDALDFAPEGTKDLIKKAAVNLPLNSYDKRKALLDQLGFDVTKAVENAAEDIEEEKASQHPVRRVQQATAAEEDKPKRRVTILSQ